MQLLKNNHPAKFKFDAQGMYTADIPSQGTFESAKDYKAKIYKLTETFIKANSYKFFIEAANWMRKRVGKTHGPGLILMHANFCRPVTVKKKFLGIPYSSEKYVPGIICIGLPAGVSIISNPTGKDEQDGFLISHESGHCRYLSHHEIKGTGVSDQPKDHDLSDKNCTMCYPFGIQSRNPPATATKLTWNRGDATESSFCGKCILKLRGWKVSGLTSNH